MKHSPKERADMIAGLRNLADFLEQTPEFDDFCLPLEVLSFAKGKMQLAATAKLIAPCIKQTCGDWFYFIRDFGGEVRIKACIERTALCEKVEVGKRIVPARPETVLPATPEKEETVWEWVCPDSILAMAENK